MWLVCWQDEQCSGGDGSGKGDDDRGCGDESLDGKANDKGHIRKSECQS